MDFNNLYPVQLYCPNCGAKITAYKDDDGAVRIACYRCRVNIFSKRMNKRIQNLKLTSPN